ncbi:hypothetical protein F3Y22_tig00110187pilonHSYRG00561 [Hibiscus syriacus]|uniref:Uncharacterized protein n=1 Tax=Hibiscus syriacus TaxID=106335 RepID=A0A6A3BI26_HIBSY|nr:hypothetical protein F3Y22_tig00110187pilonHSYRG00561 [Hibiscus syriacus]
MKWEPRHCHSLQRVLFRSGETKDLLHVKFFFRHITWQFPSKSMQKISQACLNDLNPQGISGAHPSPCPKWQQLKIMSFHVNGLPNESLRPKLIGIVPNCRVSPNGPHINKSSSALANVVTLYLTVFTGQCEAPAWVPQGANA